MDPDSNNLPTKCDIMPSLSSHDHLVPTQKAWEAGLPAPHSLTKPLRTTDLGKYTLPFPSSVPPNER